MTAEIIDFRVDPTRPPTPKYLIKPVALDEVAIRAAVFDADGCSHSVDQHARTFEMANPVDEAEREIERSQHKIARLREDLARIRAKRANTNLVHVLITDERVATQPRLQQHLAWLYGGVSSVALLLSNTVGGDFVVRSGSDVYATDPLGAKFFYALPIVAAIMLKAMEGMLADDRKKARFRKVFFTLGFAAFLVWTLTSAVLFAPESAKVDWLSAAPADWFTAHSGIILLVSHILVDCAGGFIIASAATSLLLGDRKTRVEETSAHGWLRRAEDEIDTKIAAIDEAIALAKAHLKQVSDARLALENEVRLAFRRHVTMHESNQRAAAGAATSAFLSIGN